MTRSIVALVLLAAFSLVGFGWRTLVQVRRHGDTGWRFDHTGPDRIVGPLLALSYALLMGAPVMALAVGRPWSPGGIRALGGTDGLGLASAVLGATLAVAGGAVTVLAQRQMGASWRIGVQADEQTDLITHGLFAHVRNPIFTGMALVGLGTALLVPSMLAIAGALLSIATLQAQVRLVEEPHLRSVHGATYERWAATAGRFLPGLGHRLAGRP